MLNRILIVLAGIYSVTLATPGRQLTAAEPEVLAVWPDQPPDEPAGIGEEHAMPANPKDSAPTLRITNVTKPTLSVFRPAPEKQTGSAFIICPGGGHRILAWDKEGTEVAQWLNTLGVTAIVLKYRVPARDENQRWRAAVQDAQRSVSVVRSKSAEWQIAPDRIGILGFSAGGETAALTALFSQRKYSSIDDTDKIPHRPNMAVLVYPAYLVAKDGHSLQPYIEVTGASPPMFFVHAGDDGVSPLNSICLYMKLREAKVPAELHVYGSGGHGFGLRPSKHACSKWPERCADWLNQNGWLTKR